MQAPGCLGIVSAILRGADPEVAVARTASSLKLDRNWVLIAVGKAAPAMARGLLGVGGRAPSAALIVVPEGVDAGDLPGDVVRSDHPLPTARSVAAGDRVCRLLSGVPDRHAVVLLSGGASSLIVRPRTPEVNLDEYRSIVEKLLCAGANIRELNTVRKRLDMLKGGRLAASLRGGSADVLVLSDVVGDDLSVVASGPMSPDPTTPREALGVLAKYGLENATRVTAAIRAMVASGETDTPGHADPVFNRVRSIVVAGNRSGVDAGAAAIRSSGIKAVSLQTGVNGEAREVARDLCKALHAGDAGAQRPRALVWGGETTVKVRGGGKGGRNQELALAAAIELEGMGGVMLGSFGTDGVDGPTDAAGAVVTGETASRARGLRLDPRAALSANDSHGFFIALERAGIPCLIRTGPTGTNVGDVIFATRV